VRQLLDTHLLLWAASEPERLSAAAREILTDEDSQLLFSVASIWEVVIKASLGRTDFDVDPHLFRRGLLESGFVELPITGPHVTAVADLPPTHRDPFDRILLAQARTEGLILVTGDAALARYPGNIEVV
jgi:PIN domain nuclease of toxin-antitoxin system